ncbi:MAG: inorganic phosphate transporter [Sandaracinus sp.]|nr:inorganic phosphate transporter [Sandaracinus sp.]
MGTSVGSGALTLRQALIVAAIFELAGALLAGGTVTETLSERLIDPAGLAQEPLLLAIGMTCCLISASVWLHFATSFGWPVSTTQSIVGAVLGFGLWLGGSEGIQWSTLGHVALSWVVSPLLGGLLAFQLIAFLKRFVLGVPDPVLALRRIGPMLVFFVGFALTFATVRERLLPWLGWRTRDAILLAVGVGAVGALVVRVLLVRRASVLGEGTPVERAERLFLFLQVLTACYVAFAHGSNDVANAAGPMAAVFSAVRDGVTDEVVVPFNVLLIGAFGIVLGLGTYGFRVMATIGREITTLTASRGFAAELAAATTIIGASVLGLPVSTTHTLVGAVVGVGLARSLGALNLRVLRGIALSWLATIPVTAALAALLVSLASLLLE